MGVSTVRVITSELRVQVDHVGLRSHDWPPEHGVKQLIHRLPDISIPLLTGGSEGYKGIAYCDTNRLTLGSQPALPEILNDFSKKMVVPGIGDSS